MLNLHLLGTLYIEGIPSRVFTESFCCFCDSWSYVLTSPPFVALPISVSLQWLLCFSSSFPSAAILGFSFLSPNLLCALKVSRKKDLQNFWVLSSLPPVFPPFPAVLIMLDYLELHKPLSVQLYILGALGGVDCTHPSIAAQSIQVPVLGLGIVRAASYWEAASPLSCCICLWPVCINSSGQE